MVEHVFRKDGVVGSIPTSGSMSNKTPQDLATPHSYGPIIRNLFFVAVAIGAAYIVTVSIGLDGLRQAVESAGMWGLLAVVLLKATTIVVVPLGGQPIYVIAGAAFGFWKGFLLTFIGDALGFAIAFYLSRFFGRSIISFFIPTAQIQTVENILRKSSTLPALIKARIALTALPELFAYGAGLTGVSFPIFLVVQLVPHTPFTAVLIFFGDALVQLTHSAVYVIGVSLIGVIAALIGGWWFHRDVIREW